MDNRPNNFKKSSSKRRRKRKRIDLLNIFTIVSFIVVVLLLYRFLDQKSTINELNVKSKELKMESEDLKEEIAKLNKMVDEANSLDYIEKIAREKLGMIKEGETIYLTPEEAENIKETEKENPEVSKEEILETDNE